MFTFCTCTMYTYNFFTHHFSYTTFCRPMIYLHPSFFTSHLTFFASIIFHTQVRRERPVHWVRLVCQVFQVCPVRSVRLVCWVRSVRPVYRLLQVRPIHPWPSTLNMFGTPDTPGTPRSPGMPVMIGAKNSGCQKCWVWKIMGKKMIGVENVVLKNKMKN